MVLPAAIPLLLRLAPAAAGWLGKEGLKQWIAKGAVTAAAGFGTVSMLMPKKKKISKKRKTKKRKKTRKRR